MKSLKRLFSLILVTVLVTGSFLFLPNETIYTEAKSQSFDFVIISPMSKSVYVGDEFRVYAVALSGKTISYKSSASSVASVSSTGLVTAKKPGTARITAKCGSWENYCYVTVLETEITLSKSYVSLYRKECYQINVTSSTGHKPSFKSNKTSVATVTKGGKITAKKNREAVITVTVDGVSETIEVEVLKPDISLNKESIELKVGESFKLIANVSSGNAVTWSTSNVNVLSVDKNGKVTARQKGKAYVYACEDGTKVSCIVKVTEEKKK